MLTLLLFLTSCDSANENVNNTHSSTNESNYIDISFINDIERVQIAVSENGDIYLTDEYRIHILDNKGNEKKQIINDKQNLYKLLTAYSGGFFAFNYRHELEKYSDDGTLIKKYDLLSAEKNIEKMLYVDGKLFIMYHIGDNENDKYLAECNLEGGEFKKIDVSHVQNFVEYGENTLLVFLKQDCCSGHILTYNIDNGEKSDELHIPNLHFSLYPHYSSSKDRLYLISQGTVYVASIEKKKMIETYTSGKIPKSYTACYRNNMSYYIDKVHKRIISLNLDNVNSSNNITILCNNFAPESYFSSIAYDYGSENNDIGIKFINISTEEYTTKLNPMLMSGDNSFDIYLLSTYNDIPSYYIKKGVCEDLHNYPVVSQKFDDMFEGIEKLCSYNGALFGVPVGIHNSDTVYQLNTDILEKLKLEMPEHNWTWSDFERYAEDITPDGSNFMMKQRKLDFWLFNIYSVSNCIKMDFTKESFNYTIADIKNELEFVNRLYEKSFIFDDERNSEIKDNILLNQAFFPSKNLNDSKIIPAPVFNDKRVYPFTMRYFCLNKASKSKSSAAEFLSKCISKEAQSRDLIIQGPILYKDKAVYDESIYKKFINDDWNYKVYSYLLKNSHRNETYAISLHIIDYILEYFEGRISSDEAAEAIYNKMKQIVEE